MVRILPIGTTHSPDPGPVGTSDDDDIRYANGTFVGDVWSNEVVQGLAGNDTLTTGVYEDIIYGGDGNDLILMRAQDQQITGGAGEDTLRPLGFEIYDPVSYFDVAGTEISGIEVLDLTEIADFDEK